MSTKTTFKRIALVAVASLGFGVLSSVAPASAAIDATPTAISIATPAGFVPGTMSYVPVTLTLPAGVTLGTDTVTVVARVTSAPTNSNAISSAAAGTVAARSSTTATSAVLTWALNTRPGSGGYGALSGASFNTGANSGSGSNWTVADTYTPGTGDLVGQVTLLLGFAPDAAGSYTILVAASGTASAATMMGNSTATLAGLISTSAVVATNGAPTTVALTPVNATAATTVASTGSLLKVTVANATGSSRLGSGESITLASNTTTTTFSKSVLVASDFTNGVAYVNVYNTAEETVTISATQSGTLTTLVAGATSIKFVAGATSATAVIGVTPAQTTYVATTASGSENRYLASTTRTSQTVCVADATVATATDAAYNYIKFTDDSGKLTGKAGTSFAVPVTIAASATAASRVGCATVSGTLLNAEYFTAAALTTNAVTAARFTGTTRSASTMSVTPTSNVLAAVASTNTFTFRVKDQFGGGLASELVTFTLVGRNAKVSTSAISDASGYVTYAITDAGTVGTVDTLTATDGSATKSVTITYGATTVTTMTLTGGNTTAGVTSNVKTAKDINAGLSGASATTHGVTATLKNAAGSLMSGVPVTWTITGPGTAVTSTSQTTYSAADGTATGYVYGWAAGTYTVTATAGTKTATAEITFAQTGTGEERAISATVAGTVVTAKVVDRFGNPVPLTSVYATSADGVTINGRTKDTVVTNANGLAEFIVAGSGSVSVSTVNYAGAVGSVGSGQTCARLGASDCNDAAADDTAFTASAAGTSILNETGVGASFAAAGVSTVAVAVSNDNAQAAADAAAEATDAANAATDAANAAAEAADAATAAAQDAADAVAALSTQVSEMVNALKKQITALTNLVIKIQKKVRA